MPDTGGAFTASLATPFVNGATQGFTTLDFGSLQATWRSLWNTSAGSGETYDVVDITSGEHSVIQLQNVQSLVGSPAADYLVANAQITSLFGGDGDDTLAAAMDSPNPSYLRGGAGDDSIAGGETFDDINGNQGDDTAHGWEANDWVVGGQGNDLLFGDQGDDLVLGNLGDDTLDGGVGNDVLRGGQGDDVLTGGPGDDWLSGDRGADTMTGGPGADTFHSFAGAGVDVVTDFNAAEGDRVQLDPGTTYSLRQSGADMIVDLGNGDQLILKNVQMATLPTGWIFEA
jgi:serralysin